MNNIKREVKDKINKYSNEQYLNGYIKNEFLTDSGDANIYIKLEDKNELFDKRTVGKQLDLNYKIYKYIDNKSSMLRNDVQINFHILGLELDQSEKEQTKHLIKEHYAIELYKIQKQYKRHTSKIFKLLLMGIIFVLLYILFTSYLKLDVFEEVFIFLFSFSIWEALDCLIYFLSDLKLNREAVTQKLLIDVIFDK